MAERLDIAKLLKTKLKEITEIWERRAETTEQERSAPFISACFADTPLREECFERIENLCKSL